MSSIEIQIKLYGILQAWHPDPTTRTSHHPFPYQIDCNATIQQLVEQLDLPEPFLVSQNGTLITHTTSIKANDLIGFYPPAAGG